ncbi:MAG TPA: glycosyltransferase, partial [Candidatus Poseidoniales archaeon]
MQAESEHPLTVVLPVWNEALIIEKKLENLAAQDGKKPSLLIIDSASTDDTVKRIESWLKTNQGAFNDSTVIEMERRQGKTKALQMALESLEANTYEGLICMT